MMHAEREERYECAPERAPRFVLFLNLKRYSYQRKFLQYSMTTF